MSIYVEILIRAPMDALWAHTQTPALHERWDLRFSRIDYIPKARDTESQRFRYTTRIGFGLEVGGEGETAGRDSADGSRSSALKFCSDEPFSIVREGSGYWKPEIVKVQIDLGELRPTPCRELAPRPLRLQVCAFSTAVPLAVLMSLIRPPASFPKT